MDGLIFGLLDNGVLILGAFTGLSVERYLPTRFQAGVGGVFGAGIGKTLCTVPTHYSTMSCMWGRR